LSYLLLPDRICFGQTSRIRKYLTALVLQSEVTKILAPYGINYGEMKLLQAATGAIISGSTISALVHEPFVPNDLDLYCHYPAATRVVHFIEEMAGFDHAGYRSLEYIDITGIKGVWTLLGPGGSKINVVETLASNPIKCIASSFHSSPPRGALKWDGLVHFEANQVVRSQALITPASMHLDDPCDFDQQVTSWHILHKYKARGFKYVFEYDEQHECGRHVSCPVTVRSTVDAGCLQAMLPLIRSIPCFTTVVHKPVTWSLRGSACAAGIVSGSLGLHPATGFQGVRLFRTLRRV
jgi:hypothetical protein